MSNAVIGISFDRMNAAKRKVTGAYESARSERESLSRAISSLQVEDGRLRQKAEELNRLRSRIDKRMADLQRIGAHIDYTVKRFKETDDLCAKRIKAGCYEVRKTIGLDKAGIYGSTVGRFISIAQKGRAAWNGFTQGTPGTGKDAVKSIYSIDRIREHFARGSTQGGPGGRGRNLIDYGLGPISKGYAARAGLINNSWMTDAINRGWGPINEAEYYRRNGAGRSGGAERAGNDTNTKSAVTSPDDSKAKNMMISGLLNFGSPHGQVQVIVSHWFLRSGLNEGVPQTEADVKQQGWIRMKPEESIYHQIGDGNENNVKYISPDGKMEGIYKDGKLVNDPINAGTFNYEAPTGIAGKIGHFIVDVIPYYIYGNSPDDSTTIGERLNPKSKK